MGLVGIDTDWVKNDDDCFDGCCDGIEGLDASGPNFKSRPLNIFYLSDIRLCFLSVIPVLWVKFKPFYKAFPESVVFAVNFTLNDPPDSFVSLSVDNLFYSPFLVSFSDVSLKLIVLLFYCWVSSFLFPNNGF